MLFNKIARLNDFENELLDELKFLKYTGYTGEYDNIYYDYIYKWARMMKCCKELGLTTENKNFIDIGGGLSPIHIFLSKHGVVNNLDTHHTCGWFPTVGKYYHKATEEFKKEYDGYANNINYITGDINETIKNIPSNSIDACVDCCAIHIFLSDNLINEIERVLKPGGYFISIGDIANPNLGREDGEFMYPKVLKDRFSVNKNLQLVEPFDYDTWDEELKNSDNLIERRNFNFEDLSMMNMKNDPTKIPYHNVPIYPIHLWTATYILKKLS